METQDRGRWVWHELMTSQPEPAEGFYSQVIGWGVESWPDAPPDQPYHVWMSGAGPVGGVMKLPEEAQAQGAPPHWLSYVAVEDVDGTVGRAVGLGATAVLPGMDIEKVGRIAVLQDPQGAMFALYRPSGETPGHEGPPLTGDISWIELGTTDRDAALAFYRDLFGWEETDVMDMGEGNLYHMYGQHGNTYGGIYTKPPEMPGPPGWLVYATVDDIQRAVDAVQANGGQVLNGPMEVPGGDQVAQCMDPQGAVFAIHSKASASA